MCEFHLHDQMADQEESFYYALEADDADSLRILLANGSDVNTTFYGVDPLTKAHYSALHICCQKGSQRCVQALLEAGADSDARDKWNQTPLMYSCTVEWHNVMQELITGGVDVNSADTQGRTAAHRAIDCSDTKSLQLLVNASADLDARDNKGATPLFIAASHGGHAAMIKVLVDGGSDVNIPDIRYNLTPLHACIALVGSDRLAYTRLLLAAPDLDHSSLDRSQNTHIMGVINRTFKEQRLLNDEDTELIQVLVQGGSDINQVTSWQSMRDGSPAASTALGLALEKGSPELVEFLISVGADANIKDSGGRRALRLVAEKGDVYLGLLLLQGGALLIPAMYYPYSPLEAAITNGDMQFIHFLFTAGYDFRKDRLLSDHPRYCFTRWRKFSAEEESCLHDMTTGVLSLLNLTRNAIRQTMKQNIRSKLTSTRLPPYLRSFLLYD